MEMKIMLSRLMQSTIIENCHVEIAVHHKLIVFNIYPEFVELLYFKKVK